MLFPTLGQAVYTLWWPSLTKDLQTEQLLCWNGMTDTEHSTTSGSNKDESTPLLEATISHSLDFS